MPPSLAGGVQAQPAAPRNFGGLAAPPAAGAAGSRKRPRSAAPPDEEADLRPLKLPRPATFQEDFSRLLTFLGDVKDSLQRHREAEASEGEAADALVALLGRVARVEGNVAADVVSYVAMEINRVLEQEQGTPEAEAAAVGAAAAFGAGPAEPAEGPAGPLGNEAQATGAIPVPRMTAVARAVMAAVGEAFLVLNNPKVMGWVSGDAE